ncbi:MAG: phospholipase D-like domain-containing protein, partial [Elusimicrobiota bacterium]
MVRYLLALLLGLATSGWAANIRSVPLGGRSGALPTVPQTISAPAINLLRGLDISNRPGLPSALPGLPSAPSVRTQPAAQLPAGNALRAQPGRAPAAGLPPVQAAAPAKSETSLSSLERIAAQIQARSDKPAGLETSKHDTDRDFDLKAPGSKAEPVAAQTDSVLPRGRKGKQDEASPNSDDGGGPGYPRRTVAFNEHEFPSVAFRPNIPIEEKIIEAIDNSRKSIRIALYEFKLRGVLEALHRARSRGVKVEIILDYSNVFPENHPDSDYKQRRSKEIWGLIREGIDFTVLRGVTKYGILHNKFAIFDGKMAEFGSFNWSFSAEKSHYENAHFSIERARVKAFNAYWTYLRARSVPFDRAQKHDWPKTVPPPPAAASASIDFNGTELPAFLFMPGGSAFEDTVVKALDAAKSSVDVAMFALRSTRIAQALARARKRGLNVRVVMDQSQSGSEYFGPYAGWLANQDISIRTLAGPNPDSDYPMAEKMHHKFMVLDGELVETGSANWTKRASMDNYENAHFLADETDAAAYLFAFNHMFKLAQVYPRPDTAPTLPTDAELENDIQNPPAQPSPDKPEPPPLPAARNVRFHGRTLPSFALLPYRPIEPLIVEAIDAADKSISLAIYEFTSEPILDALRRAKKRGLAIEIVLDRAHLYTSGIDHNGQPRKPKPQIVALVKEGFDMKVLRGQHSGIMHNKYLVLDEELVMFGSYNLTDVAEKHHFENVIFSRDSGRVEYYGKYFAYKRELAEEIDPDKLDELLSRTLGLASADEPDLDMESADGTKSAAALPSPPEDEALPLEFNGERFPNQLF